MTMSEYEIRLLAYRLKKLDEQEVIHYQAWANQQVKATKNAVNVKFLSLITLKNSSIKKSLKKKS